MEVVIAAVVIVVLIGLYILSFTLNQNTEKPEGCEDISCSGCKVNSCVSRKKDI